MKLLEISIAKYGIQINGGISSQKLFNVSGNFGWCKGIGFCQTPYFYIRFNMIRLAFRFLVGVE